MAEMGRTLRIVTHRHWMVQEMSDGLAGTGWQVQQHYGMSLPPADGSVLWMPGQFAARLTRQDACPRLVSPGVWFMPGISPGRAVRRVRAVSVGDAVASPIAGFWKIADVKIDSFPAAWRTADELVHDLDAAAIPAGSMLHHTATRLDVIQEYRAVVVRGVVTTGSHYTDSAGIAQDDPAFASPTAKVAFHARRFSEMVAHEIAGPRSYTLDVGFDRKLGRWVVVEANPIWSSAWYGCDLVAYAAALEASQIGRVGDGWAWQPDPYLAARADRMYTARPLPQDASKPLTGFGERAPSFRAVVNR